MFEIMLEDVLTVTQSQTESAQEECLDVSRGGDNHKLAVSDWCLSDAIIDWTQVCILRETSRAAALMFL